MSKLRKGIEFPIIPEDFINSNRKPGRKVRKPSTNTAKRIHLKQAQSDNRWTCMGREKSLTRKAGWRTVGKRLLQMESD